MVGRPAALSCIEGRVGSAVGLLMGFLGLLGDFSSDG